MCSFLMKNIINNKMVDNVIGLLNNENWGILYHADSYNPDVVLYHTNDTEKMRNKIITLMYAYYKNQYSFNIHNIILFKIVDVNPKLVTLDLLDRTHSKYFYIIKNCKFNKTINHEVSFLIGEFAGVIQILDNYAVVFERNVSRTTLIEFYKEKTGVKFVKWHKTKSEMRRELTKYNYDEIRSELNRMLSFSV
uniref:Uncharacterized protein n=1 Tax=viral metagenome TaxID=1070528 RepID=A0A6C0BVE3_9ZZZZ